MPKILTHRKSCRFCNHRSIKPALRFEPTPLKVFANATADEVETQERQPLILSVCENCKLVQLLDVTDPGILHRDHPESHDVTPATREHYESYAREAAARAHLEKDDLVIDIGSGNGALRKAFEEMGMAVVSVDPGIKADDGDKGPPTHYQDFFTPALANDISQAHGKASLVTANYVLGSVDNIHAFIAAARHLLKPDGLLIVEEPYLADIVEQSMFDTINHKRLSFITAGPFDTFLKSIQMHLIEASRNPFRRGTIRMTIQKSTGLHVVSPDLESFIEEETAAEFYSAENMNNFAHHIEALKNAFRRTVADLKSTGNTIAGYGATGRSITFVLECGWQAGVLEYIVHNKEPLPGTYLAGTQIPVRGPRALAENPPSHILIFNYHEAEYIMDKHKDFAAAGGKFIIPFPGLKIV